MSDEPYQISDDSRLPPQTVPGKVRVVESLWPPQLLGAASAAAAEEGLVLIPTQHQERVSTDPTATSELVVAAGGRIGSISLYLNRFAMAMSRYTTRGAVLSVTVSKELYDRLSDEATAREYRYPQPPIPGAAPGVPGSMQLVIYTQVGPVTILRGEE